VAFGQNGSAWTTSGNRTEFADRGCLATRCQYRLPPIAANVPIVEEVVSLHHLPALTVGLASIESAKIPFLRLLEHNQFIFRRSSYRERAQNAEEFERNAVPSVQYSQVSSNADVRRVHPQGRNVAAERVGHGVFGKRRLSFGKVPERWRGAQENARVDRGEGAFADHFLRVLDV